MEQSQTSESCSLTESAEEESEETLEEKIPKMSKRDVKKIKKAQKKEQQLFSQIQRSKRKAEELTGSGANPSSTRSESIPAHFRPYLTKEVVGKFLDILGNKKGQTKKKEIGYQRRGWGTIEELTDVLRGAGWLTNQKETAKGVQRTKHGSSTISYRMPLKNNLSASDTDVDSDGPASLMIQFHNDHMRGALIREITRHFIIRAVEGAGLTESSLEKYYIRNFLEKK